jgi:fructose-bisphosphate aldolase class II
MRSHGSTPQAGSSKAPRAWTPTSSSGRLVWTRVHREYFAEHPENFDLRPPGKVFMKEYAKFIAGKNEKLGSAGQLELVRRELGL